MTVRNRLLIGQSRIVDFMLECGWLVCNGELQADESWELAFTVWIIERPRLGMERETRHNPTDALRLRLAEEGINTRFGSVFFVRWLVGCVPTINLTDLMSLMKRIVVASPEPFCEPIIVPE
jgi:hypothetical protein